MRSPFLSLLAFVLFSVPAFAQTAATLAGHVEDAAAGRLPGTSITVTDPGTGFTRSAVTDGDGRFTLTGLPAGDYVVRAELQGFRTLVQSGLRLTVGEQASLVLRLEAGATEEVRVTGGA